MAIDIFETKYLFDVKRDQGKHWIIIGAGGNGAYFIRDFMRQVKIQNDRLRDSGYSQQHHVTVVDADDVEAKNLTRQNFIRSDIGKLKAEVMADRYSKAFGEAISFVGEYISDSAHLKRIAELKSGYPVFIGAVDNNKTRKIIYDCWKEWQGAYWIDAGNEEWGGQVVCGFNYPQKVNDKTPKDRATQFRMPCVVDIYPEIFDAQDKHPGEESCAERAVSAPQNIFTNLTAANILMGFANSILAADKNIGHGLKAHASAFNTLNMFAATPRFNNFENLQVEFDEKAFLAAKAVAEAPSVVAAPAVAKKTAKTVPTATVAEAMAASEAMEEVAPF